MALTHIGDGIYSYLSPKELKNLRRCVGIAYSEHNRDHNYRTLACQPERAREFMKHPEFNRERQEPLDLN